MSHIITVIFTGIVYLTAGANPATPTSPFRVLIPNLKMHTVPGVPEHVAYLMFETADFDPVATKIGRPQLIFTDQFTRTTYGVVFLDNEDIQVRSIDSQFKIGMNPLKADTTGTLV